MYSCYQPFRYNALSSFIPPLGLAHDGDMLIYNHPSLFFSLSATSTLYFFLFRVPFVSICILSFSLFVSFSCSHLFLRLSFSFYLFHSFSSLPPSLSLCLFLYSNMSNSHLREYTQAKHASEGANCICIVTCAYNSYVRIHICMIRLSFHIVCLCRYIRK